MLPAAGAVTDDRRAKLDAELAELAAQVREKYPWVKDYEVSKIYRCQKDNEVCEGCTGNPCRKDSMKYFKRGVYFDERWQMVRPYHAYCKHHLEYQRQETLNRNFRNSKIPRRYVGKTFADYKVDKYNADAVDWAKWLIDKGISEGLLLYGVPGCGKTFLAAIIAQELIHKGKTVIFGDVPSILNDLKATFDGNSERSFDELMNELESADMLILDDMGVEYATAWAATQLYNIVNNRYNAQKAIIATTNYGESQLKAVFKDNVTGQRIVSRLWQMCEPIQIGGSDRRLGARG